MRDRASENDVALKMLSVVYPGLLDVGCFSHAMDLVGSRFSAPTLENFVSSGFLFFPRSPKNHFISKTQTGRALQSIARLGGGVVGKSCTSSCKNLVM